MPALVNLENTTNSNMERSDIDRLFKRNLADLTLWSSRVIQYAFTGEFRKMAIRMTCLLNGHDMVTNSNGDKWCYRCLKEKKSSQEMEHSAGSYTANEASHIDSYKDFK